MVNCFRKCPGVQQNMEVANEIHPCEWFPSTSNSAVGNIAQGSKYPIVEFQSILEALLNQTPQIFGLWTLRVVSHFAK